MKKEDREKVGRKGKDDGVEKSNSTGLGDRGMTPTTDDRLSFLNNGIEMIHRKPKRGNRGSQVSKRELAKLKAQDGGKRWNLKL